MGTYSDVIWGLQPPQWGWWWELLGAGAAALQRASVLLRNDRTYGNFSC